MEKNSSRIRSQFYKQWVVFAIMMIFIGGIVVAYLYKHRSFIEEQASKQIADLAKVIDVNIERQFDTINRLLVGIRDDLPYWKTINDGTSHAISRLRALTDAMPGLRTIAILNAEGTIEVSNRDELIGRNFSDRDYFKAPRQKPDKGILYVSPPFKTVLGVYSMGLTRVLLSPNGEFEGVVGATLDPELFLSMLEAAIFSPGIDTALNHSDGIIFLSATQKDIEGKDLAKPGTFYTRHVESGQIANNFKGTVYASGRECIIALRTVKSDKFISDKSLMVAITYRLSALLAHWYHEASVQAVSFFLVALGGALGLYFYQRRIQYFTRLEADYIDMLQKSETQFKFLAENMGDIVWTLDLEFNATYVSPSIEKVLGFTPEERKQQKLEEMVTPESMERITTMLLEELQRDTVEAVDPDRSLTIEVEYFHRDGSIVWIENIVKALRDESGKIIGMYGVSRDITQRKQAEEKIVKANIEWERTFNAVPDLIAILDTQYRIVRANKAMADKLGLTPQEAVGSTCYGCVHGKNEPPSYCPNKRLLSDGKEQTAEVFEERLGGDFRVTVSPILDSEGQLVGSVHLARDITERKRSEEALRKEYAFRNAIIDHVAEGLCVCHETTEYPFVKFTIWNERMAEITGYTLEEINRLGWYQTVYPDPELRAKATERMQRMRLRADLRAEEWEITRADGNKRVLSISSSIIESDDGLVHVMTLMQDITERKRIQDALQESETRYRLLADNAMDVIWTVDFDNRLTYVSPSIIGLVGFTVEEAMERTMQQAFTPTSFDNAIKLFAEEMEIESTGHGDPSRSLIIELEMFHKKGYTIPIEGHFSFLRNPTGKAIGILSIVRDITERKRTEIEREKLVYDLRKALQDIKRLSGLLPICSYCKKIRDDKGYWTQIESYIREHSEAEFSHSICKECAKKHYPDLDL